MILEFSDAEFSIKELIFKPNQKSQLQDWGFKSDTNNNLFYTGRNADKTLIKVINYFYDIQFAEKHWFWLMLLLPLMIIWYVLRLKKQEWVASPSLYVSPHNS